jgi:hypothetical protein
MAYTNINKPTDYFETKTWSGASGDLNITGLDFQPDWVWIKSRNTTGADHKLVDVVRGSSKSLKSNENEAESTDAEGIQSFNSDGYTLGDNDGNYNRVGRTYVGWNWLAGGTASSNTDGSITSTVSANTTSGFSIVSYTGNGTSGATVGHGLGSTLNVYMAKRRSDTGGSWYMYHSANTSAPETDFLHLNENYATEDGVQAWNDTAPTSSVFSLGDNQNVNANTSTYIAYCFAEKKGYSKFGSYTGNGSTDGTYVHLGFKPAFVLYKQSSSAGNQWEMRDNLRDVTFNPSDKALAPNLNSAEFTTDPIDLLSNGFKFRGGNNQDNGSGSTYIYMAFAENPFVTSTGIPTTAR